MVLYLLGMEKGLRVDSLLCDLQRAEENSPANDDSGVIAPNFSLSTKKRVNFAGQMHDK